MDNKLVWEKVEISINYLVRCFYSWAAGVLFRGGTHLRQDASLNVGPGSTYPIIYGISGFSFHS